MLRGNLFDSMNSSFGMRPVFKAEPAFDDAASHDFLTNPLGERIGLLQNNVIYDRDKNARALIDPNGIVQCVMRGSKNGRKFLEEPIGKIHNNIVLYTEYRNNNLLPPYPVPVQFLKQFACISNNEPIACFSVSDLIIDPTAVRILEEKQDYFIMRF